jgi:hypothetical protein
MIFSRPCGTYTDAGNDPALKRRAIFGLSRWDEQQRSVAVPGHSNARTATRFGQTDAGLLCHVAAPGDGRTPAGKKTAAAKISLEWTTGVSGG